MFSLWARPPFVDWLRWVLGSATEGERGEQKREQKKSTSFAAVLKCLCEIGFAADDRGQFHTIMGQKIHPGRRIDGFTLFGVNSKWGGYILLQLNTGVVDRMLQRKQPNWDTADFEAWGGSSWLSSSPYPLRHPVNRFSAFWVLTSKLSSSRFAYICSIYIIIFTTFHRRSAAYDFNLQVAPRSWPLVNFMPLAVTRPRITRFCSSGYGAEGDR